MSSLWVAVLVEQALLDESRIPTGALYSVPEAMDEEDAKAINVEIDQLHGRTALLPTTNQEEAAGNPKRDWEASRTQPEPSESLLKLRSQLAIEIVGNFGRSPGPCFRRRGSRRPGSIEAAMDVYAPAHFPAHGKGIEAQGSTGGYHVSESRAGHTSEGSGVQCHEKDGRRTPRR